MSDTTNALSGSSGANSGLINALAHPTVVNPLAAYQGALQTANSMYEVRQKQAQQAAGEAFLNSIDPATGQPNQALLMQNLKSNPATAMYAQESAQRGQNLDTTTYNLHNARLDSVMSGAGQLIADNPNGIPGEALRAYITQQRQLNNLSDQEAQAALSQISGDPRANTALVLRGIGHGLAAKTALDAAKPPTGTADVGGRVVTTQTNPQLGTSNAPTLTVGPGVTTGPPVGGTVNTKLPVDDQGVIPLDANGNPTRPPKRWDDFAVPVQKVPGMPTGGQPVPAPGSPAQPGSNAPPPPPLGSTIRSPGAYPGKRSDIPSSLQVASADNSVVPSNLPPATPPSPAVAGDVAAIQGGMAGAQATPTTGTQTAQLGPYLRTAPPSGYTETLNNDIKARTDASMAAPDQRKNLQAGENAFEALRMAGNYTGAGTGTAAALYSWLQARAPQWAIPQGEMTDTAWRQVLAKNLLRFAQESGLRMNTDLGMSEALKGTANADTILPNANREILINDIGNARQRLAQTLLMPSPSGDGAVVSHFQNYTSDTDPRAFAWDLRSADERQAIEDEVAKDKSGKAEKRLNKGLEDAYRLGLIKLPQQRSEAAPASTGGPPAAPNPVVSAPTNALAMATPANALAA